MIYQFKAFFLESSLQAPGMLICNLAGLSILLIRYAVGCWIVEDNYTQSRVCSIED